MVKLTTKLLSEASRIAREAADMSGVLTEAFVERYGVEYSEINCDWLIDDLDYGLGNGHLTLKQADDEMTAAGHPPLRAGKGGRS